MFVVRLKSVSLLTNDTGNLNDYTDQFLKYGLELL